MSKSITKTELFASTLLIFRIIFGGIQAASASDNPTNLQKGSQTTVKIPHGGDGNSGQTSKFTAGSKAKAAARRDFARRQTGKKPTSKRSGGSSFADAFTVERTFPARPGGNGDGLFGRLMPRPTPDPQNPGCAGGPRSITSLSGQHNSNQSTKLTGHDGFEAELTDKSENHLTSKHGNKFGVNDPLPPNPNQKPTKYPQNRTRINKENKATVRGEINGIISNPKTDIYYDVNIRGIQGQVYHCKETDRIVAIHTEGEFAGQIMKAQPISPAQLQLLKKLDKLD